MRLGLLVIIAAIAVSLTLTMPAEARETYKGKALGIVLSNSCLSALKAGINSTCYGYEKIIPLDNSNQKISGKFILKDGILQRGTPQYPKGDLGVYKYNSTFFIFVDPPRADREMLPLIFVEPSLPEYLKPTEMKVKELNKVKGDTKATHTIRLTYQDRWVDAGCFNARISAKGGLPLLLDTIQFMKANCDPAQTSYVILKQNIVELKKHDISTSYKYKLEKQYNYVIKNCLQKRNACTDVTQASRAGLK